jgi:hypothetical protein
MANNQRKMARRITPKTGGNHNAPLAHGLPSTPANRATKRAAKKQITTVENRAWRAEAAEAAASDIMDAGGSPT